VDEISRVWNMHRRDEKSVQNYSEKKPEKTLWEKDAWENNIKMDLKQTVLNLSDSGWGPVTDSGEHHNEP
jgi:hypothetical protein